jgi:hypothetical protein
VKLVKFVGQREREGGREGGDRDLQLLYIYLLAPGEEADHMLFLYYGDNISLDGDGYTRLCCGFLIRMIRLLPALVSKYF